MREPVFFDAVLEGREVKMLGFNVVAFGAVCVGQLLQSLIQASVLWSKLAGGVE